MRVDEVASSMFERVVLEKVKLAVSQSLDPMILNDLTVQQSADFLSDRIAFQVRAYILGREGKVEEWNEVLETIDIPLTWWDHVKSALISRWPRLEDRLHVATKRIEKRVHHRSSVWHVCPHGNTPFPGRHVEFMQYDGAQGYSPLNIETEAREAVDLWKSGASRDYGPRMMEFDRAMHAIRVALDRADKANAERR